MSKSILNGRSERVRVAVKRRKPHLVKSLAAIQTEADDGRIVEHQIENAFGRDL